MITWSYICGAALVAFPIGILWAAHASKDVAKGIGRPTTNGETLLAGLVIGALIASVAIGLRLLLHDTF